MSIHKKRSGFQNIISNKLKRIPFEVSYDSSILPDKIRIKNWFNDTAVYYYNKTTNSIHIEDVPYFKTIKIIPLPETLKFRDFADFKISTDLDITIIEYDVKSVYRYSSLSSYSIFFCNENKFMDIKINNQSSLFSGVEFVQHSKNIIAFFQNDIYYMAWPIYRAQRVTFTGNGSSIINGVADWVYEEEIFEKSLTMTSNELKNTFIYCQFNDSDVQPYYMNKQAESPFENYMNIKIPYPKPGENNPSVALQMVFLPRINHATDIIKINKIFQPSGRYIVNFDYLSNENEIMVVSVNREQNTCFFTYIDQRLFQNENVPYKPEDKTIFQYKENSGWVDYETYKSFHCEREKSLCYFLMPSKQHNGDYYHHLHSIDKFGNVIRLTEGIFEIKKILGVKNNIIYFYHNFGNIINRYLGAYDYNENSFIDFNLFNVGKFECNYILASLSDDCSWAYIYCLGSEVPFLFFMNMKNKYTFMVEENNALKYALMNYALPFKEIKKFSINNVEFYVSETLPRNFYDRSTKDSKFALLIDVYGGPGSQTVMNTYNMGWAEYIVSNYDVIYLKVDVHGSSGRGQKFKYAVNRLLGQLESFDVIEIIKQYTKFNYVDKEKICVWGWSFGGYLSTKIIMNGKEFVKCAIAVAPVVDWRLYDSIYTERYMGSPKDNLFGYETTSLLNKAQFLKNTKYLIIHGDEDDNVHLQNTLLFTRELTENDVDYEMQIFAGKTHSLDGAQTRKRLYSIMTQFLVRHSIITPKFNDLE